MSADWLTPADCGDYPESVDMDAERIEAEVRRKMAAHAAIADRGFDTWRQRQTIHVAIDELLDDYLLFVGLPELPPAA
ncbi:hypothetical protein CFH99_07850 [Nocardioides aromaticivorans]|uniref:Uncharacterized protein n=1 Tax=Nocardioides aromaticivorans TaxID=200618 RepID=A0ABX7PHT5_9ACTN|nr:hypothetical protein [Nocardioides aromaticivorans]QSR25534.1 hypothetical protein CFH99_07850 [Nocardioides aromaticivorans]